MNVSLEEDGRVTLPEFVRIHLGLLPGDPVLIVEEENRLVISRATPPHNVGSRHGRPADVRALPGCDSGEIPPAAD